MPSLSKTVRLPLAVLLLLAASSMALSQNPAPGPPATSSEPVISDDSIDDFADLSKNLANLQEKIGKVKRVIAKNEDPSIPASQRAALRSTVAALQTSFADDGEVAQLGEAAIEYVNKGLEAALQDAQLSTAQRDALVTRWRRLTSQTQAMVAVLDTTRKDLADKLRILQEKEALVDQMAELKQARTLLDAIGDLADQRQALSDRIKDLLEGRTKPPDM